MVEGILFRIREKRHAGKFWGNAGLNGKFCTYSKWGMRKHLFVLLLDEMCAKEEEEQKPSAE